MLRQNHCPLVLSEDENRGRFVSNKRSNKCMTDQPKLLEPYENNF